MTLQHAVENGAAESAAVSGNRPLCGGVRAVIPHGEKMADIRCVPVHRWEAVYMPANPGYARAAPAPAPDATQSACRPGAADRAGSVKSAKYDKCSEFRVLSSESKRLPDATGSSRFSL